MPLSPNSPTAVQDGQTRHILFGEDDPDEEDFLKEIFGSLDPGCSLTFINNGKKLLAVLEKMADAVLPRLIVLDYNMPELNGAEILKELKRNSRYNGIPKIIWSTSGSELYKKICLESGAKEYFIKPSSIKELENLARRILTYCPA